MEYVNVGPLLTISKKLAAKASEIQQLLTKFSEIVDDIASNQNMKGSHPQNSGSSAQSTRQSPSQMHAASMDHHQHHHMFSSPQPLMMSPHQHQQQQQQHRHQTHQSSQVDMYNSPSTQQPVHYDITSSPFSHPGSQSTSGLQHSPQTSYSDSHRSYPPSANFEAEIRAIQNALIASSNSLNMSNSGASSSPSHHHLDSPQLVNMTTAMEQYAQQNSGMHNSSMTEAEMQSIAQQYGMSSSN
jgi:hypothetical protein